MESANLEPCLPAELRGPSTTITRIAAGLSGAGVYRVAAPSGAFVLKVASDREPLASWRTRAHVQQLAAAAGVAPRVVHVDESRRAIVSELVVEPSMADSRGPRGGGTRRSFPALYGDPRTRDAALALLGKTLRRVHDLPLPAAAETRPPRALLAAIWAQLAGFAVPGFVTDAVPEMLAADEPVAERPPVLSHNDVNPTNLVYDGTALLLLDWDTAGPNDPFYDLAAISAFLAIDDAACLQLLAAYDGVPSPSPRLPARFTYSRRLVAVLCGTMFLHLARVDGHAGATGETLETTPSLVELYARMRSGALSVAAADGKWSFGLALIKASVAW